jgi:hypothetical protein
MNGEERSRLDVIEAKVDTILLDLKYIKTLADDHETRIRSVEKWKLSIPISVLLAIATVIGSLVHKL